MRTVLLCAGGTGGHLFPAEAVAGVLEERGWHVELATDRRAKELGGNFPASAVHIVPSATPSGRGVLGKISAGLKLTYGVARAFFLLGRVKPALVAGFGGYPTVPPVLAAKLRGIPTIIHDQNAVLGRANRLLARFASQVAAASDRVTLPNALAPKLVVTGNPVRATVRDAAKARYRVPEAEGPIRLLVFGGSQGARIFSEVVSAAIAKLDPKLLGRLRVVQQCRPEDLASVEEAYRALGVEAELASFFANLPTIVARSHLVISRSGATTVSELGVIGRPAILVPLPGAIDQDQRANAEVLTAVGGAWMFEQKDFTAARLAHELSRLFNDPAGLAEAAGAAARTGRADGAERLADVIEDAARNGAPAHRDIAVEGKGVGA